MGRGIKKISDEARAKDFGISLHLRPTLIIDCSGHIKILCAGRTLKTENKILISR